MSMNTLFILTEEPSIKNIFDEVLPKILPQNFDFRILPHQGKNDLERAISDKISSLSRIEGAKILITIDQDTNDCIKLKKKLIDLIGKNCSCDCKIRIVCRELESWLLGDLPAIEKAYPRFRSKAFAKNTQMRNVDKTKGKPSDLLLRIIPEYKGREKIPKLECSKKIAPFLDIANNNSNSFNHTISAIKQLCGNQSTMKNNKKYPLELNTMPGFAGSSAYYIRYEDPHNDIALVDKDVNEYWRNVDLYIGGTEHATGHLIYSRFWNKFLFDLGVVCEDEPFKKLINQGMIQGRSNFVYRIKNTNTFVSYHLKDKYEVTPIHVDVNIVSNDILDIKAFKNWNPEYKTAEFILEDGKYICGWAVEKMSKSMYNVVNPDDIVAKYGADTLRLYEMFLGPLEQSKPWDTNGIDGVHRFLRKLWNLFYKEDKFFITEEQPTAEELKSLHKLIKKVAYDIENFSFNTSVAAFMICVNELTALKCNKKAILSDLIVVLSPFAPHIAEELWHALGNNTTVCDAKFPDYNEAYLVEDIVRYTVSFNGKARYFLDFQADTSVEEVEKAVLAHENSGKWLEGKTPKKVIVVKGKIVNVVI